MTYSERHKMFVYQAGDRVRVRKTPLPDCSEMETSSCYGGKLTWLSYMNKWCGKIVTIERFCETDATYLIEEDGGRWWWCNGFFESNNGFECNDDVEDVEYCSFGDYFEKFKVV